MNRVIHICDKCANEYGVTENLLVGILEGTKCFICDKLLDKDSDYYSFWESKLENYEKYLNSKITESNLKNMFRDESESEVSGKECLEGLNILSKYSHNSRYMLIWNNGNPYYISSLGVSDVLKNGMTVRDAKRLRKLGWDIDWAWFQCWIG